MLGYLALFSLFFIGSPLITNLVPALSPSDMIYTYDNYSYLKPDNYRTSNELPSDQTTQFEPWKFFARDQLRQGIVPWVNPYQAQGVPFIGNDQSAVFFPTNILFYLPARKLCDDARCDIAAHLRGFRHVFVSLDL